MATADAQIAPGGMGPGPGGAQPAGADKKEGVAEAAPKTPGLLPTTPALPAPKGRRKRWKLFEIDGYFRLRTDWFKNFHEGFNDKPGLGGSPFPRALDCGSVVAGAGCDDTLSSTNMRLRLEPTINLDEGTSIHIQADILDNQVLGGTPTNDVYNGRFDSADPTNRPPLGAFGNSTQSPPIAGVNSDRDSIQIKRAWAEVAVPLGIIKAGRQPNHWGMGLLFNSGGRDPINGTYDYDADYGDSVDRVSFSALIPGTNLRAMLATDWALTRLSSNQTQTANRGHEGHPFDLDDGDDTNAWTLVLSRMDSPQEFKDKLDRGDLAVNYGVYFEYKTQGHDLDVSGFEVGTDFDTAGVDTTGGYRARGYKTYSPDVWGKLGIGKFLFEAELVAQLGKVERLDEYDFQASGADIRKYGGTARMTFRGLDGKLRMGVESGFASGDQHDNVIPGNTNIAFANLIGSPNDHKLSQFIFNREYKVDMILWRHLVGAVTNAGYVKPSLSYDLTKSIGFTVANITSFALKPVATPGNGRMYGTEFNADIGYRSGGLYVGFAYGVLFPFAAMSHPATTETGADFGFKNDELGNVNVGDAKTSHTIQSRLVLSF
ncbi:MAG: TIGR04551 family protein [Kofleriaceae bacterium]